jgi:hypothetical protein
LSELELDSKGLETIFELLSTDADRLAELADSEQAAANGRSARSAERERLVMVPPRLPPAGSSINGHAVRWNR